MTRRDILECSHEPFADAFYLGPELMSERFSNEAADRGSLGMSCSDTYQTVLDSFAQMQSQVRILPSPAWASAYLSSSFLCRSGSSVLAQLCYHSIDH